MAKSVEKVDSVLHGKPTKNQLDLALNLIITRFRCTDIQINNDLKFI